MTRPELDKAYTSSGRDSRILANTLGLSRCAVENRLRSVGIPLRTLSEFITKRNLDVNSQPLDDLQKDLMFGSLLGDACIHVPKNSRSILVRFCHSNKQFGYLKHKWDVLDGRGSALYKVPVNNFGSYRTTFSFTSAQALAEIYSLCTVNGSRRVNERWVSKLNLNSISYLWEDDGSLIVLNPRTGHSLLVFYTNSFDLEECELIQESLKSFGLSTYIRKAAGYYNGCRREYPTLASNHSDEARHFLGKLICHDPCLKYKFRTSL